MLNITTIKNILSIGEGDKFLPVKNVMMKIEASIAKQEVKAMEKQTRIMTEDSKYIQQHLANERTYLAWIRTAIAITGIGFLIINLHIKSSFRSLPNIAVQGIGALSVLAGISTIIFSTISYFQKAKQINEQTFRTSSLSILMLLVLSMFGVYFFAVLL